MQFIRNSLCASQSGAKALVRFFLNLCLLLSLAACGFDNGNSKGSAADNTQNDQDSDGIPDLLDEWPTDPDKPVISSLWGINGELWDPAGRLPFVALAGYGEGVDIPEITRVVADVTNYGATGTPGSDNDTVAFQNALNFARSQVSIDNPGVLYIPAGIYDIDQQLHLDTSGLVLRGAGRELTTLNFMSGLINDGSAAGSDAKRRKLIVMGGKIINGELQKGLNWQQWDNNFSAGLDINDLPQRGDYEIHLREELSVTLKQKIIEQGYRIRLGQALNYGESSTTPLLAAAIYGGPDFAAPGSNGGIWVTQQFVVTIATDNRTLVLDRPLRFTPSYEDHYGGVRIAVRDIDNSKETEQIGVEHLTVSLPATPWLDHFGTEGQGGIDIFSDNSWVRHVRLVNADNGIEVDSNSFNNTISNVVISGNREPRRSGPSERRYDAFGHHGLTLKGRDHMLKDFSLEVSYVHDVTLNNCHGCVVMGGSAEQMNMDHHRQAIFDSVWTEIDLGIPHRMWHSTGNPAEGFNASAYNTYWNIRSSDPSMAYWPEDGEGSYPQWGYHNINIVAMDVKTKPAVGEGQRPNPYHPDNAHLETMNQEEVWPQNIYTAQREFYIHGLSSFSP